MTTQSLTSLQLLNITECSICLETFKDPRVLPCIHTFCLECMREYGKDRASGDQLACPLCRNAFAIPPGGIHNLPSNFFMNQLLQVNQSAMSAAAANANATLCDLCTDANLEIAAKGFCVECDQHMCDRCCLIHKKQKISKSHQILGLSDMPSAEERLRQAVSYCTEHPDKQIELFCNDCAVVTCISCYVEKHNKHQCTDIRKSAETFREQILRVDIDNVSKCSLQIQNELADMDVSMKSFVDRIAVTENRISWKYEQLVSLIQAHQTQLMFELGAFKSKLLKEMSTAKDELERDFVIMESFKRYCEEMNDRGTACDISRSINDLHVRAEELIRSQKQKGVYRPRNVDIIFMPSIETTENVKNLIGAISLEDEAVHEVSKVELDHNLSPATFLDKSTVVGVMPKIGVVNGITVLGNELFVIRGSMKEVDVYDSSTFELKRNLTIPESKRIYGIVSCSHFNCLYISDYEQNKVHRYDLSNNSATNWSISGRCYRLSVTKEFSVLAVLHEKKQIEDYTTNGTLIREIFLDGSIETPLHCVQLSTGFFAVSHTGGKQHRVCIVDFRGRIIASYGGATGSEVGFLNSPYYMAVDKEDRVLVADWFNNKVQVLSLCLTHVGDVSIPGHQLSLPHVLHLDDKSQRLFIGESSSSGSIFVLKGDAENVTNTKNNEIIVEQII